MPDNPQVGQLLRSVCPECTTPVEARNPMQCQIIMALRRGTLKQVQTEAQLCSTTLFPPAPVADPCIACTASSPDGCCAEKAADVLSSNNPPFTARAMAASILRGVPRACVSGYNGLV